MDNVKQANTVQVSAQASDRRRAVMEAKVNVGLILRVMLGAEEAAHYMLAARVPKHVVMRVVLAPDRCRRLDAIADELRAWAQRGD